MGNTKTKQKLISEDFSELCDFITFYGYLNLYPISCYIQIAGWAKFFSCLSSRIFNTCELACCFNLYIYIEGEGERRDFCIYKVNGMLASVNVTGAVQWNHFQNF